MNKDIIQTIEDIQNDSNLTASQKSRLTDPQTALIGFLNSHLNAVSAKNELKEEIETQLLEEVQNKTISLSAKLKIFELLLKKETDSQNGTLAVIGKMLEVKAAKPDSDSAHSLTTGRPESGVSQQDMKEGQEAIKFINELKKSEGMQEFFKKKE